MKHRSIALVLSSGGARGYAHIGVIEALLSSGHSISSLAGCSIGAVVAGIYAAGGLEKFKQWACSLERSDVFKLYDFVFSSRGLIRGEKVFKQIEEYIPECNIESLNIPFTAVATDLNSEKEVIFRNGPLFRALRASSAIPAVVQPTEIDGMQLLDGGILNPLPIHHVARTPGDLLIAVDVNAPVHPLPIRKSTMEETEETRFQKNLEKLAKKFLHKEYPDTNGPKVAKKMGLIDLMAKSIDMMQDQLTSSILQQYPPDILIQVSRQSCNTFDYYRAAEMIEAGRMATQLALRTTLSGLTLDDNDSPENKYI